MLEAVFPYHVDASGTIFDMSESYRIGRVRVPNIKITGQRINGKAIPVKTTIRLYPGVKLGYIFAIGSFLESPLLNDSFKLDSLDIYEPETTEYVLNERNKHSVGFDETYKVFYYEFKNSYTTHRVILNDPKNTLEFVAAVIQNIKDTVALIERNNRPPNFLPIKAIISLIIYLCPSCLIEPV